MVLLYRVVLKRVHRGVMGVRRRRETIVCLSLYGGKTAFTSIFVCLGYVLGLLPMMQGASLVSSQYMSESMIPPWQQALAPPSLDEQPDPAHDPQLREQLQGRRREQKNEREGGWGGD